MSAKKGIGATGWISLVGGLTLLLFQLPALAGGGACTPAARYNSGQVIKYRFESFSSQFSVAYERALIGKAFRLWSNLANLGFTEVSSGQDILVRWQPLPPNVQGGYFHSTRTIAFNSTLLWSDDGTTPDDLFHVAAHEMGHALGLCHTTGYSDVMGAPYGFGPFKRFLRKADIDQLRSLYSIRNSTGQVRNGLTAGDFEVGSGREVSVLRNSDGNLYTFAWKGFRQEILLSERASNWHPGAGSNWLSLVAANLDGQPGDEMVAMRNASNGIYAYGVDQYGYHLVAHTTIPGPSVGWINMVSGDFVGDQKDEIIAVRDSDDGFYLCEYDGTSKLRWMAYNNSAAPTTQWQFLESGDFDGNGRDELIAIDGYNDTLHIYEWNGTSSLQLVDSYQLDLYSSFDWQDVTTGDFDGDGRGEIMTLKKSNNRLFLFDVAVSPFGVRTIEYTAKSRYSYYDKKWTAITQLGGYDENCAVVSDDASGNLHLFCYTPSQSPYIEWKAEG